MMPLTPRQLLELSIAVHRGLVALSEARRVVEDADKAPRAAPGANLLEPDPLEVIPRPDREDVAAVAARLEGDPEEVERTLAALKPVLSPGVLPRGSTPLAQGRHYALRRELARGGGGRVMVAMDGRIGREVAYKEILGASGKGAGDRSAAALSENDVRRERFLREARVTGQLEHPNIVPVYEIGEDGEGGLFYTMKLVRGRTLRDRILEIQTDRGISREEKLGRRLKFLDAFVDVCQAVAYAHSRGVINRDLKPANVMIGDFGETVVLDWGLARVTGQEDPLLAPPAAGPVTLSTESTAGLTMTGQVIGTPLYMSPEQARGDLAEVGERSDVYSLGMMLYEIVTGYPPWDELDPRTVVANVLTRPPVPVRSREPQAAPELIAIIERATVKDPRRRMESAGRLAAEVLAFRDGRSLTVYRYSLWEQLNRLVRRHQAASSTAALVILALVAALATALVYGEMARSESETAREALERAQDAEREARERASAEGKAREAAQLAYRHAEGQRLSTVSKALVEENPGLALLLALEAAQRSPGLQANHALLAALLAVSEVRRFGIMDAYVRFAEFSPDGACVATGADDHTVRVFDAATGRETVRLERHTGPVTRVAWSRDGRKILSVAGRRATLWTIDRPESGESVEERVVDAAWAADRVALACEDGRVLSWSPGATTTLLSSLPPASEISATPDGRTLLLRHADRTATLLDAPSRQPVATMPAALASLLPDGTQAVFVAPDGLACVLASHNGQTLHRFQSETPNSAARLALSADGRFLVYGNIGHGGTVRRVAGGAPVRSFAWPATFGAVAFSPDGATLARGNSSRIVWEETETGHPVATLQGHEYDIESLAFSSDGSQLLSASRDRTAALWERPGSALPQPTDAAGRRILSVSPSGTRLVVSDPGGLAVLAGTRAALGPVPPRGGASAFSSTGLHAVVWDYSDRSLRILTFDAGASEARLPCDAPLRRVAFSPGGRFLAAACTDGTVHAWDTSTRERTATFRVGGFTPDSPPTAVAVTADGAQFALGHGGEATFSLWNARGESLGRLEGHTGFALAAAFSPDGQRIVTTAADASARVWKTATPVFEPVYFRWPRIEETVPEVSPDGATFLVVGAGEARLASMATGAELAAYVLPGGVAHARFATDGLAVIVATGDGKVRRIATDLLALATARAPRELTPAELARYEVGTAEERRARASDYDRRHPSASAEMRRGRLALFAGKLDEAAERFRAAARILPWQHEPWVALASTLCRRWAARAPEDPARAEDLDDALTALETAVARGLDGSALLGDPDLAPLHGDPRFSALAGPGPSPPR